MTTAWIEFIDAAYPPSGLNGAKGLCFYAGGDTPHVWSLAEVQSFHAEYLLPVYVRSNPQSANALADAAEFVNVLLNVYHAPHGVLVALDSETSIDPAYVVPFVTALNAAGYPVIDYGSESDVHGNQNPDGYYWGADWTGIAHIVPGDAATQYVSFPQYDLSEFESTLSLWNTQAPPTLAFPIKLGDTGPNVVTVQRGLNKWAKQIGLKAFLTTDGSFGALTKNAVKLALIYWHYNAAKVALGEVDASLWTHLLKNPVPPKPPAPKPYPAPAGLAASEAVSVQVAWKPVSANGKKPLSYTVTVVRVGSQVVGTHVVHGTSTTLTLNRGWTYKVTVQANGGPAGAGKTELTVPV